MSTQPDDDSYPDSWKPRHVREREQQDAARSGDFETRVAALSDEDLDRIRKGL